MKFNRKEEGDGIMIQGLFEAHLPVSNLEISIPFYQNLGLEIAYRDHETAFFWIDKGKSWLGLWEGKEVETSYHPSLRHIAFRVDYEFMKQSLHWLKERNISAVPFGTRENSDPFIRPYQGNASVYFTDPDGNSLEFMCSVPVPNHLKSHTSCGLNEWERLLED
jgi:catechol 2,3-dioxygenase-like lactoylglutathione lyase family enzyme